MRYDDVVAGAFRPSTPGAVSPPTRTDSPSRRLRDAIEPLAMHAVWSRTTNERLAELGLDFFSAYVWGRAAALGEPDPGVVVSSFAVFEPALVIDSYVAGRAACDRDTLLEARTESTIASLSTILDPSEVGPVAQRLQAAVLAASGVGRPLYAGLAGRPWPDDPIGRLWHACELTREHRGDSHVAVCVERGLDPVEMNVLTELWVGYPLGGYSSSRGWSAEAIDAAVERLTRRDLMSGVELTDEGHRFRDDIERATDRLSQPIVDRLLGEGFSTEPSDEDEFGVDGIIETLASWSELCIDAEAFPPDVFKRAAG